MLGQADTAMTTGSDAKATAAGTEVEGTSERTCAGCRQQDARASLVRLAVSPDDQGPMLVPDLLGRLGGRGVSVHANRACLQLAANRGGFAKSLKRAVVIDEAELARSIEEQLLGRAKGLLLGGIRSKRIALGTEAVMRTIENEKLEMLIIAHDAATRTVGLAERVRGSGKAVAVLADKALLGGLTSRGELAVLSVLDRGIAREIGRVAALLSGLTGLTGPALNGSVRLSDTGSGASPSKSEAE